MGVFVLVLLPLAVGLAVTVVPEYPYQRSARLDWRDGIKALLRNPLLRRVLATDLMVGIPGGVMGALYVFFVTDIVEAPRWLTIILLGFFAAGLLGVPLTVRLSYRIGKHNAMILCMATMFFITAAFLSLGPGDVIGFSILIVVSGLIFNGLNVMLRAITADLTDIEQLKNGSTQAGLYYALLTLTSKVGYAAALVTYPVLEWLGYDAGGDNGTQAINALRYTFVGFPMVALTIGIMLMWRFPIGAKEQRELRRQLADC